MLVLNRIQRVPSFARMHQEINDLFNAFVADAAMPAPGFAPAMNVWESDRNYFIEAELPGFQMEDIDVTVLGDTVTIKGERKATAAENAAYLRRERRLGEFTRTFTLPSGMDPQAVEASLTDGVLLVTLPKTPAAQPRRIAVKSGKS